MAERTTELDGELDADRGSRVVTLTIPAKPEYITLSRLALTGLSHVRPLAEETLAELKLALTEATSNSVRHAYADEEGHVDISFELLDDRLIVEVADDGAGFEPADPALRSRRLGLTSMEERAQRLGGRLEIRSAPGAGTTVRLEVGRA